MTESSVFGCLLTMALLFLHTIPNLNRLGTLLISFSSSSILPLTGAFQTICHSVNDITLLLLLLLLRACKVAYTSVLSNRIIRNGLNAKGRTVLILYISIRWSHDSWHCWVCNEDRDRHSVDYSHPIQSFITNWFIGVSFPRYCCCYCCCCRGMNGT